MLRFFDRDAVAAALDLAALIDAMDRALVAFSAGAVIQPSRMRIPDPSAGGNLYLMPAVTDLVALKVVANYPGNHARGLESHNALIVVFDRATGIARAVLDGTHITTMRTAAVSAAAARRLALPDARVLAVMGTGVQARSHCEAMRLVRDFDEIRIWGRDPEKARRLADEVGGHAVPAEEAVRGADVVATTTSAREPILRGEWLKPGAHVSAVGWNGLDGRELDDATMANAVVVESREAAGRESGNIIVSGASIRAELGEVLAGTVEVSPTETTVFVSIGMAVEDAFAASLVLPLLMPA